MTNKRAGGDYNVVVIGAGTAGLVTGAGTAALGGRVALIERHKMGGDCLNFGCVPSKALIASARLAHSIRHASEWGVTASPPGESFATVFDRMRERRANIAPHDSQERFESLGVDVFRGEARFVSPHEVQVGETSLKARHFVIATGTRAARPSVPGLDQIEAFTNETIFDQLREKPGRLLVVGGGPIGCELAQALGRLGVRVTIVQQGSQLVPKEDDEVGGWLRKTLTGEGITVLTDAQLVKVVSLGGTKGRATIRHAVETIDLEFDALLLAAGRQPNIESLGLEAAGVKANKRGIEVNEYLQTTQPHIYAAGDVTGRFLFTHMADAQARIVVRNILMPLQFLRQRSDVSVVPWCTYTDPEIAHVGLNERDAKEQNLEFDIYRVELSDVDRAVVENATSGFATVLTRKGTDKILGATIVAERAGDLLQPIVLAMHAKLGLGKLATAIYPYPTFVEVVRKLGDAFNKTRLTPRAKSLFRWLYAKRR